MKHLLLAPIATLLLLLCSILIPSCKRPTVAIPESPPDNTLVLFIGGFQTNQLHDVYTHLKSSHPELSLVWFNNENCYETDVSGYVNGSEYTRLILIGHSWGCARITADSGDIPKVDLAVFFDPVGFDQGSLHLPSSIQKCIVFPRTGAGVVNTARVFGPTSVFPLPGGHSDGCHNPESFETIDTFIKELLVE